jgi:hypothetical protein
MGNVTERLLHTTKLPILSAATEEGRAEAGECLNGGKKGGIVGDYTACGNLSLKEWHIRVTTDG